MVEHNDKYGFINKEGKIAIPIKFSSASFFNEGLALVVLDDKYGFIDKKGHFLIKPQFSFASSFSDGIALVWKDNKEGFINSKGEIIIPFESSRAFFTFKEGMTPVQYPYGKVKKFGGEITTFFPKGSKYGYINRKNEFVIKPQFECAGSFSCGLAAVKKERGSPWGFIDTKGNLVIPQKFYTEGRIPEFSEGLAALHNGKGWGYIDKNGNFIIKPIYVSAEYFSEGLGCVGLWSKQRTNGRFKYIYFDKKGNKIIEVKADFARSFKDGLAVITTDYKKGYINKKGKWIIPLKYDSVSDFSEEIASVRMGNKYFIINKQDKIICEIDLPPLKKIQHPTVKASDGFPIEFKDLTIPLTD